MAFLIKVIFPFGKELSNLSELLLTLNSLKIYFSGRRTLESSPNKVVNQSEIKNSRILRIQTKFIRSPSQGLFAKSDLYLLWEIF
jgi:hypothetical protein